MRFQISQSPVYNLWTNWFEIYMTPYSRSRFSLTKINPLETAGLGKILHKFAISIGTLQILCLISENSSIPRTIAIFV